MPAPQLHLTFGDLVQHNPLVPVAMRRACAAEPVYARLGSIFHDLPYYYAPMVFEAVRYGLGAPALDEPWGYRLHSVHPDRLVASYIRAARTVPGLTDQERLALVGGLLSHCAIDLAMHPLVNYCARRDVLRHGGHESTHHRLTEKYQALFHPPVATRRRSDWSASVCRALPNHQARHVAVAQDRAADS
jgi:hypothetical protein